MTDNLPTTAEPQRPKPPALQAGGQVGALVPQTLEEGFRLAQAMAMSGMTPRDIDTPEKVLVAIMAGAELGMKPFQAVQSFAIVNGRPSLWGDGLMALALTNGLDVEEWLEGEGDARTAFCRVTRPDNGKVVTRDYSVEKAKTAKLWGKVSANGKPSPWVTSPERMLQMRARSYAIRDAAADVLRGMPIKEEVEDFIEANPGIMERQDEPRGTGLLAKLETAQVLSDAAVEGFGVRNLDEEAGEAAPAAEPKKRERKKSAAQETLDALPDGLVETRGDFATVEEAIASGEPLIIGPGDTISIDHDAARLLEAHAAMFEAGTAETIAIEPAQNAPQEPQDAQVEPEATTEPETAQAAPEPIDGPAPNGVRYFLADKPAFLSGRRVVYVDGQSEKEAIDDTPEIPTYTAHPVAPKSAEMPPSEPVSPATTELPTGAEIPARAAFMAAIGNARDPAELVAALRELFSDPDHNTPEAKRLPRQIVWETVAKWNAEGRTAVDPVSDPFLLACYIETETDLDAVEQTLPLARDQEWFKAGGEPMQASVARAVLDRVTVLRGG